jgi:UTP-glucose-1-phosphate uridylyltransferase
MTLGKTIKKAVIPAAGLGTRFLPATKAMPKEMLPVVDQPAIQYVVEEAVKAGLTDLLMITGRQKRALEDHFDREPNLERTLEDKGDVDRLEAVQHASSLGPLHYVRQGDPKGLGHAVLCARQHVGDEPFAVLLGDDLIDERDELLSTMIEVQARTGGSVIALIEVDPVEISAYGCADVSASTGKAASTGWWKNRPWPTRLRTWPSSDGTCFTRLSSTCWRKRSRAAAAKSSSPTPYRPWPPRTAKAGESTAWCSRAAATTPETN